MEGDEADVKMTPPEDETIKLSCGVFRCGDVHSVTAKLNADVDVVRDALGDILDIVPGTLRLYLAKLKGENGDWVKTGDDLESFLLRGLDEFGKASFRQIYPSDDLKPLFQNVTGIPGLIHVLVDYPENTTKRLKTASQQVPSASVPTVEALKATALRVGALPPNDGDFSKLLKWNGGDCGEVKDIPEIEDIVGFTGPKFFVRKEILCVLENLKEFLKVTLSRREPKEQFILMGSPGTGKSCILALVCFYLALVEAIPVVWHRRVGGGSNDLPVTRLFDKGKYYEWYDVDWSVYKSLRLKCTADLPRCWFALDGLNQDQLNEKDVGNMYMLLATSGQFISTGEGGVKQTTCMVPYWRQDDLEDLAKKITNLRESDFAKRYFVSGGNVRFFVTPVKVSIDKVTMALTKVNTADADALLTSVGAGSRKQIDHLRGVGVSDLADPASYTTPSRWKALVTSKMAMEYLLTLTKPDYFQRLLELAKDLNDPRLQGIVLEQLFHSYVANHKSVGISYMKYDNVKRTPKENNLRIMRGDVGTVTFGRSTGPDQSLVKRKGNALDEYAAMMEEWAKDPDMMDYWIPASSTCETIDAVAKWNFVGKLKAPNGEELLYTEERFCLLQLTMAETHTCEASVLMKFAQPFIDEDKKVCYMALLCGGDEKTKKRDDNTSAELDMVERMEGFRLRPVVIKEKNGPVSFPLSVATYTLLQGLHSG